MTIDLSRVHRLSQVLAEKRFAVTGHLLRRPNVSMSTSEVDDEATFRELVTSMYIAFHEAWGDEIHHITETAPRVGAETADTREFGGMVVDLRTTQQHSPDPVAVRRCQRWFQNVIGADSPVSTGDWARCAGELVAMCVRALSALVGAVNAIAADDMTSKEWIARASASVAADPDAKLGVVLGDLGLSASAGQRKHLAVQVDHDWKRRLGALRPSDDADEQLANTVARVVIGWSLSPLPCTYSRILDAIGMTPGPEAVGALVLAHAVADLCDFRDEAEFLELVVRSWDAVRDL